MCLVISLVFSYLAIMFFSEGDLTNAIINGIIALVFIVLLIRNILRTKKEREKNG
jgi:glucose uptake protein GlcU